MFVEFPFIWLTNLKFVGRRIFFHEKYLFCHALDSTARDGHTTFIPPPKKKNSSTGRNWAYSGVMTLTLVTMNMVTTLQYSCIGSSRVMFICSSFVMTNDLRFES